MFVRLRCSISLFLKVIERKCVRIDDATLFFRVRIVSVGGGGGNEDC